MRGASSSAMALGDDGGDDDDADASFSFLFFLPPFGSSASRTESFFFRPPRPRAWRMRRARMPSSAPFMAVVVVRKALFRSRLPSATPKHVCLLPPQLLKALESSLRFLFLADEGNGRDLCSGR